MRIIKRQFPDVKLYIPGATRLWQKLSFKERLRFSSYDRILRKQIEKYELQDNIVFMGKLSPEEMAKRLSISHVFVMPSMIENHSSSLIEAMMIGTPTVSSFVGGVNSYYNDGVNGFFYRAEEPEHLASIVNTLFRDEDLCRRISSRGKFDQRKIRLSIDLEDDFIRAYNSIKNK